MAQSGNQAKHEAAAGQPEASPSGMDSSVVDATAADDVQAQLAAAVEERDVLQGRLLRAQAELDTARRRRAREMEDQERFQSLPLVRDLLPALDNLRRAVDAANSGTSVESLRQGVELVLKQVDDVFAKHGATPILAEGEAFDPNLHEAISQMPAGDRPPLTVMIEAERGYRLHDRVVRPSKVVVAAPPAP